MEVVAAQLLPAGMALPTGLHVCLLLCITQVDRVRCCVRLQSLQVGLLLTVHSLLACHLQLQVASACALALALCLPMFCLHLRHCYAMLSWKAVDSHSR